MGRLLKNPDLAQGSSAARLPIVASSSYGDAGPVDGLIRFNQDTKRIEFYYNSAWSEVAKIGAVQIVVDNLGGAVGDGSTSTFTMSQSETDPTAVAVFVGGVYQTATTHYTVSGTQITFQAAPPAGTLVPTQLIVIHNINSTNVPA
jgi:hypothetical protein